MQHKFTNRLINETSPYLLQHAHNPVNWYPWSEEAVSLAKKEDKVILVSIGYSACHWCHVMERESFENADTAAIMNEYFINIKIDREERPDLDHIYMDAVQAISGSGGWPLNVFLTPDAMPFYGGTYFPPVRAFNRMSWREVLHAIANSWKEKRHEVEAQAHNLTAHISNAGNFTAQDTTFFNLPFNESFGRDAANDMFDAIMKSADTTWGGFGRAPKFPQTFVISYLLQFYHHTQNERALQQALLSIDKMIEGGIYDHIGGGMSRYSTDEEWLAPHFEKMLYDNALLILALCDAYQVTGIEKYKTCVDKTISFLENEMLHSGGGFYSAIDADSEGEEGKFYIWSKSEAEEVLGSDAELFCSFYNITAEGNWEGKNILRVLENEETFTAKNKLNKTEFCRFKSSCIQKLLERRNTRERPGLDDKIIISFNALLIKALARSSAVFRNDHYAQLALNAFEFISSEFSAKENKEHLMHTWKNGQAKYAAFLDDYAFLIDAAIELYGVFFDEDKLLTARKMCDHVLENFSDADDVLFYYTGRLQQDVIVRKKELYDGAIPSGNAVMAHNLHRLSLIFDEQEWGIRAEKMLQSVSGAIIKYPSSFAVWASLLLTKIKAVPEIIVTGKGAAACARQIRSAYFLPGSILMAAEKSRPGFPLLAGKNSEDFFQIFICRNKTCLPPLAAVEGIAELLRNS